MPCCAVPAVLCRAVLCVCVYDDQLTWSSEPFRSLVQRAVQSAVAPSTVVFTASAPRHGPDCYWQNKRKKKKKTKKKKKQNKKKKKTKKNKRMQED